MNNDDRELDFALAESEQENRLLKQKVADYEGLIRDLTDALRTPPDRNAVLEEVAREFDRMTVFGDTAASFAMFVRGMKK